MKQKIYPFFLLTYLLSFCFTYSQDAKVIEPSETYILTKYIQPYSFNKKTSVIKDSKLLQSTVMNDKLNIFDHEGEKRILRVQSIQNINFIDSSVNQLKGLKPVYLSGHNVGGTLNIYYDGMQVNGKKYFVQNDSTVIINYKSIVPLFDSNILDLVIASLPLNVGYTAKIPTYVFEEGGITWADITVVGKEELRLHEKNNFMTLKVEMTQKGRKFYFWFSEDNHEFIKMSYGKDKDNMVLIERLFD